MVSVVIGVDPHKRSATIAVLDKRERVVGQGRFGTDNAGYQAMLTEAMAWPRRVWAVEGCNGVGKHLAQRLVADGETVVDVPATLSARARVFSTGHGRKTDDTDARSVAQVALRTDGLNRVAADDHTVALRFVQGALRGTNELLGGLVGWPAMGWGGAWWPAWFGPGWCGKSGSAGPARRARLVGAMGEAPPPEVSPTVDPAPRTVPRST